MQSVVPVHVRQPCHRRTASQWQQLCDAYESSCLTRKQFCQKHSLALSSFDYWRHKLKKQKAAVDALEPIFVELTDNGNHCDQVESDHNVSSSAWAIVSRRPRDALRSARNCAPGAKSTPSRAVSASMSRLSTSNGSSTQT